MADFEATIHNERTKLTATYLNGAATAVLAVGALAPLFSVAFLIVYLTRDRSDHPRPGE